MKLSARNQWPGTVVNVKRGVVTAEVVVRLAGGEEVVSVITLGSIESLGIEVGKRVVVLVKSTEVMLAVD